MTSREHDPLSSWQETFPLPDSFDNIQFRQWALNLPRKTQLRLVTEVVSWSVVQDPPVDRQTERKMDHFIGGLIAVKGQKDWLPNLSMERKGTLARLAHEEELRRKDF